MPNSVLTRQRSWVARIAVLAMIASVMVIGAVPAGAAGHIQDTSASCPSTIPSAGFTDIGTYDATTQAAINCIADYGISKGTSATTYGPGIDVARWQMALFLTRQAAIHGVTLPSGADQGFTDISGLDAATQTAINQLAQLGISKGTSATTFAPTDSVTREQMALFLTRLLGAVITLPASPASAGFTDIAGLSAESQLAINQLAELGVAAGTSATTYAPAANVLRWQMALFLTRVLAADNIRPGGVVAKAESDIPQLVRVAFDAEDTVRGETRIELQFDEAVVPDDNTDVWLAGWDGTLTSATSIDDTSDDTVITAIFDTDDYDNAVAVALTPGAVSDIDDDTNTYDSLPLNSVTVSMLDWTTEGVDTRRTGANGNINAVHADLPELLEVKDIAASDDEATFVFDQTIDFDESSATSFYLVEADGDIIQGDAITNTSNSASITVDFDVIPDEDDIVRAYVLAGGVDGDTSGDNDYNLNTFVDVSAGGAQDDGVPYVVDITIADVDGSSKQVEVEFSEDLDDVDNVNGFEIIYADGHSELSTAAVIKSSDDSVVQVTFTTGAGSHRGGVDSDLILYVHVLPDTVTSFPDLEQNDVDGKKFGPYTFAKGDSAGPDLVSTSGSAVGLDSNRYNLVLTFDEDVEDVDYDDLGVWAFEADGDLVDLNGDFVTLDVTGNTVTLEFTGATEVDAFKDGDLVLIAFEFGADDADGVPYDDFEFTTYPTQVGCGCDV